MEIDENILARIYSFDLKFKGGKRTKFYRKLFGYKSKTTKVDREGREKVYKRFYPGFLTPIPHLKLGKSVIAVPKNVKGELDGFFEDPVWGPFDLHSFDGILHPGDRSEAMEKALDRIKVALDETLRSEIDRLLSMEELGRLDPEDVPRIRRVLDSSEDLMGYDWTDDRKFSKNLEKKLRPLRKYISGDYV